MTIDDYKTVGAINDYANEQQIKHFETSADRGDNVNEVFEQLTRLMIEKNKDINNVTRDVESLEKHVSKSEFKYLIDGKNDQGWKLEFRADYSIKVTGKKFKDLNLKDRWKIIDKKSVSIY